LAPDYGKWIPAGFLDDFHRARTPNLFQNFMILVYVLVQSFKQPFIHLSQAKSLNGGNDTYFYWYKYSSHVLGHQYFNNNNNNNNNNYYYYYYYYY